MAKDSLIDSEKVAEWRCMQIMFELMDKYPTGYSADELYREARAHNLAPYHIRQNAAKLFKQFLHSGYLVKTKTYKLSERNSSPLPIYVKRIEGHAKPLTDNKENQ